MALVLSKDGIEAMFIHKISSISYYNSYLVQTCYVLVQNYHHKQLTHVGLKVY